MEKHQVAYCTNCREKKTYTVKAYKRTITVKGVTFSYVHQEAFCTECGLEVYCAEINDYNVQQKEDGYRKAAQLITITELEQLLEKYNIGAGPLANLMGLGEVTINRYISGQLPSKDISARLLELLASPMLMDHILEDNKEKISSTAYKKCRAALDELLPLYGTQKIEQVTRYILARSSDITPLALQKLLYYAQSFYYAFFGVEIFSTPCQAWQHGPVYPEIYSKYKEYGANPLEKPTENLGENLQGLTETETVFLDNIIDVFGRYSGSFLRNLTHRETPWKEARRDLGKYDRCSAEISRETVHQYFADAVKKYQIQEPKDMILYVQAMSRI